jgi:hypothetical protein
MREFLYFDTMITPKLITLVYWIALVVLALGCVSVLLAGEGGIVVRVFTVVVGAPLGALMIRVYCELLMVLFKINDNIQKLADR